MADKKSILDLNGDGKVDLNDLDAVFISRVFWTSGRKVENKRVLRGRK